MGLKEALTHRMSSATQDGSSVMASGMWLALGYACLTLLIGFLVLPYLVGGDKQDLVDTIEIYMMVLLPFSFMLLCLRSVDQGRLNFARHNAVVFSVPLLYLIGLAVLWGLGEFTVTNVVWANLASVIVVSIVRILLGWKWLLRIPSFAEMRRLFVTGSRYHATAMVMLIGSQADRLILVPFWDKASIGLYAVALTIASAGIGALSSSFQTVVFPSMAHITDTEAQRAYLSRQLRYAMVLLTSAAVVIAGLSPLLIPLLFGEEFRSATTTAIALTLALVPFSLRQILISALRGIGESFQGTISEVIALVLFMVLVWPFSHFIGLMGIAAAMLASNVVAAVYLFRYLAVRLQLYVDDWWGLNRPTVIQLIRVGRQFVMGR